MSRQQYDEYQKRFQAAPQQPAPPVLPIEMTLEEFGKIPTENAGDLVTALKARLRLSGVDVDNGEMAIKIRGDKVSISFTGNKMYGIGGSLNPQMMNKMATEVMMQQEAAQNQMQRQVEAMQRQMMAKLDCEILELLRQGIPRERIETVYEMNHYSMEPIMKAVVIPEDITGERGKGK